MGTYAVMLAPIRAQLDQILRPPGEFFRVALADVGQKSIGVRNALERRKLAHLIARQRHQADIAPRLGLCMICGLILAKSHHHIGECFRRRLGLSRDRKRQVPDDQLSIYRNGASVIMIRARPSWPASALLSRFNA